MTLVVTIDKKLARQLGIPARVGVSKAVVAEGKATLRAAFTKKAKRKLAKLRKLKLTATVAAADSAANVATAKRVYTLKR
jgi:hypothetical protein